MTQMASIVAGVSRRSRWYFVSFCGAHNDASTSRGAPFALWILDSKKGRDDPSVFPRFTYCAVATILAAKQMKRYRGQRVQQQQQQHVRIVLVQRPTLTTSSCTALTQS